jgi:hypothetical protein
MLEARSRKTLFFGGLFALFLVAFPKPCSAQVHWDVSLQAGVMKRFLFERPPNSGDAGFGPTAQLTGHVALLPFLRLGAYAGHDLSPGPSDALRSITFGGVRVRGDMPWFRENFRAWLFAGFGYDLTYSHSYDKTLLVSVGTGATVKRDGTINSAWGGFFELPFGLGAAYKLSKKWALVGELGARAGFAHHGDVYVDPGPEVTLPDRPNQNVEPLGLDSFAIGLTVGVMLDL